MKKILVIALAMSLLCILAVGSTMSYLTYTDFDVNTMAVGNVKIEQIEQKRDGSDLEDLKLMPVVEVTGTTKYLDSYDLYDHRNVVDKIVTVKNTGSEEAYVRTVFAFEMKKVNDAWVSPINNEVWLNVNGNISFGKEQVVIYRNAGDNFTTDSTDAVVAYVIGVYTYDQALATDATSAPSLLQVYLHSSVGNDFFEAIDGEYEILVLSQAVQTTGFVDAQEALGAAFGEVTAANAAEWFQEVN